MSRIRGIGLSVGGVLVGAVMGRLMSSNWLICLLMVLIGGVVGTAIGIKVEGRTDWQDLLIFTAPRKKKH